MVKMVLDLLILEDEIRKVQGHLDQLADNFRGLDDDAAMINIRDRVKLMDFHVHEILDRWPHLSLECQL